MKTPFERAMEKVQITEDCWLWTGAVHARGYGNVYVSKGVTRSAHIVIYEHIVGPVPPWKELDHTCRVHLCVNPDHLEPVTHKVNTLRGMAPTILMHRLGICKRGHSLANNPVKKSDGTIQCRVCKNAGARARWAGRALAAA